MIGMLVRFDIRPDSGGWSIVDTLTGKPAMIDGLVPDALDESEAGEIADLLNTLAFLQRGAVVH